MITIFGFEIKTRSTAIFLPRPVPRSSSISWMFEFSPYLSNFLRSSPIPNYFAIFKAYYSSKWGILQLRFDFNVPERKKFSCIMTPIIDRKAIFYY